MCKIKIRSTLFWSYIVLLMFSSVFCQEQDTHSPLQLDSQYCFDCHQCSNPTIEDPCLKRCPYTHRTAGLRRHSPEECPEMIIIDLLSDLYQPVVFAHLHHAEMCEMGEGCGICHHYSPPGEMPPCNQCHGGSSNPINMRQPGLKGAYHRQCLSCHREWSHDTACEVCHLQKIP